MKFSNLFFFFLDCAFCAFDDMQYPASVTGLLLAVLQIS